MNCNDVRQRLDATKFEVDPQGPQDARLVAHIETCAACADYVRERKLGRLLAELPAPRAREGFADQALANAWAQAQDRRQSKLRPTTWAGGLAAGFMLAVVVATQWPGQVPPGGADHPQVVQIRPAETRPVQIRLVSREAHPDATLSVELDSAVALTGYSGQQVLTWRAALAAGVNEVTLPLELTGTAAGTVVLTVAARGASKRLRFVVEPGPDAQMTTLRLEQDHERII